MCCANHIHESFTEKIVKLRNKTKYYTYMFSLTIEEISFVFIILEVKGQKNFFCYKAK